jgi:hypothetical protein
MMKEIAVGIDDISIAIENGGELRVESGEFRVLASLW